MQYKLTLLIGLPGSGKTVYGHTLEKSNCLFYDDFSILYKEMSLEELDVAADLVIADPRFCDAKILESAINRFGAALQNHKIELVYFENAPNKCQNNVRLRNDGRKVEKFIETWSKIYNPPKTAKEIWNVLY